MSTPSERIYIEHRKVSALGLEQALIKLEALIGAEAAAEVIADPANELSAANSAAALTIAIIREFDREAARRAEWEAKVEESIRKGWRELVPPAIGWGK